MPDNITYNHETVLMEMETFSNCEFRDSRLVYTGGETGHPEQLQGRRLRMEAGRRRGQNSGAP